MNHEVHLVLKTKKKKNNNKPSKPINFVLKTEYITYQNQTIQNNIVHSTHLLKEIAIVRKIDLIITLLLRFIEILNSKDSENIN